MTATLSVARTRQELWSGLDRLDHREEGPGRARVALVPTMGALHDGHAALIRHAREVVSGPVVVSIFVNPLQFGPGEDLERYPRTLEADLEVCAAGGADLVFAPSVEEMYPGTGVTVDPGPLATVLEGEARPTHFRGVLTVVAKLFTLVRPDVAVFGEKDYQQLALVRRMSDELFLGVEVIGLPTVREPDGLARSSRNRYLDPAQRERAPVLSRALFAAREAGPDGPDAVLAAARKQLDRVPEVAVDYLVLTAPDLGPAPQAGPGRMLVAGRLGETRLIDNIALTLGTTDTEEGSS